jgi:hypothetical protein
VSEFWVTLAAEWINIVNKRCGGKKQRNKIGKYVISSSLSSNYSPDGRKAL